MKSNFIVAIDGPAGAGKSTIAKLAAERFNFLYIDTGAMYRALTLKALNKKVDLEKSEQLSALMEQTVIDFKYPPQGSLKVFLDGEDVTEDIRSPEVTNKVFYIAGNLSVREKMAGLQRKIAEFNKRVVLEGRDIGTVIFPKADIKFFLDADIAQRGKRRYKELKEKGIEVDQKQIEADITQRDARDKNRTVAPLKKADDAVYIDTTNLSIKEVFQKVADVINDFL